ncbi:MucR family transcriptional regulator [Rhizobium sp. BK176]|uniref:MucR family transcriptional regulator n=1 Tax=Rhizobium sp. BK176 TaxID=2587071 RepID=UPI0021685076|nr:MucR family transcriptional regulator [Rhizobium sp. BK176]MCS4088628.1 hypothetical protein [Rhizobium sp. BK176]
MAVQASVDIGNAHLEVLMGYTRTMVAANKVQAENAPAFMNALSEAMMATVSKFEAVADAVAKAAEMANDAGDKQSSRAVADKKKTSKNKTEASSGDKEAKVPKYAKTAKMRAALTADGPISEKLPAVVAAYRFVAPKRGVGRPRKDAPVPVLTEEQLAFDKDFLEKHPVLEGLTEANSIGEDKLTILFDGTKLKMINRYLWTKHGITVEDYRRIYGLDPKYPSCAAAYREERRRHARRQGLGTDMVPKTPKSAKGKKANKTVGEVVAMSPKRVAAVA